MDTISQIQEGGQPLLEIQNVKLLNETCTLHEGNRFEYLCIDSVQQDVVFKCVYCVTDEDVKQNSLIPLKQVVNAQDKTIFANFPLTDRTLTQKIKQITNKPATSEALKLQIDQYFKDLTATILAKLESVQSSMVAKAQSISNLSGEIVSMYNAMSEKENLKQILLDASKPSAADKSPDVVALCTRVLSKDSENQQAIQVAIEKVAILEKAIDFETPKQIKESVLRQLEQIDMFLIEDIGNFSEMLKESKQLLDPKETVKAIMNLVKNKFNDVTEESCLKFQDQLNLIGFALTPLQVPIAGSRYANLESLTENQTNEIARLVEQLAKINQQADNEQEDEEEEKNELKSDELFELISNQTNFCSKEYLHDVKVIFEAMRGVFELFQTCKLNERTKEQKSFNSLNSDQLKNIARLATKVNELTASYGDQYLMSNLPQQQVQSNSAKAFKYLKDSRFKNISVEEEENKRRDFEQLLVNYPIFETLPSIQIQRILPPMIFTRSTIGKSAEMGITYNGSEVQLTLGESKNGQCNSQILDNNRGFSLKLRFNRPFGPAKRFQIGLFLHSKIPCEWVNNNSPYDAGFMSISGTGASKITRGQRLTNPELGNVTSELEFRWCVAKRQFFYSDATYQNINQVDEKYFSPTEQYCFAVLFSCVCDNNWTVTISDFKEIDPNEVDQFD